MRKALIISMAVAVLLPTLAGAYTTDTLRSAGIKTRIEFDTNQDGTTVTLNESGLTLNDNAGVDSWAWRDSDGTTVCSVNSNGNITMDDATSIGLGEGKGRIEFDDAPVDTILFQDANVFVEGGRFTFNVGNGDHDFRFHGDTLDNLLYGDAGNNRIGILTNTPSVELDIVGQLLVTDDVASGYPAKFVNDGNNTNRWGIEIQCSDDAGSDGGVFVQFSDGDGTNLDYLTLSSGNIIIASTSDRNLKNGITTSTLYAEGGAIDALFDRGRIADFNWKNKPGGARCSSWIAQELMDVYPNAVTTREITVENEDGTTSRETRYYILRANLIAPMFVELQRQRKALKRERSKSNLQQRQIEYLRTRLATLVDMSTFPLQ